MILQPIPILSIKNWKLLHQIFISVKDENGKSYRVSVSEHEELRNCTLNDAIGIITWAGKRYIAFDHLMLIFR